MSIYHLTLAVRGRRALARDEAERRVLMRSLVAAGGSRLLLPSLVDEHLHGIARTDQPGYLARDLRTVIGNRRPELEFKQVHLEPVDTRAYLRWLVKYLLGQPAKHGLPGHPALWTGSSFQDLVGARLLPGFDPRGLWEELPRFRLGEVFETVGLRRIRLEPANDEAVLRAGAARIVELATGVFAVGPVLCARGRSKGVVQARTLAAQTARAVGIPPAEIGRHLSIQSRAVRSLAKDPSAGPGMRALRLRLALEERARVESFKP